MIVTPVSGTFAPVEVLSVTCVSLPVEMTVPQYAFSPVDAITVGPLEEDDSSPVIHVTPTAAVSPTTARSVR